MFCMLYSNELAASLLADLQYRPPVNVFISYTCTTFSFLYCKAHNNNNNNNYLTFRIRCKDLSNHCSTKMVLRVLLLDIMITKHV